MTLPLRLSRRRLLQTSALSCLSFCFQTRGVRAEPAETSRGAPVLVGVFLRGAVDGLNVVVPHAESEYYRLRPSIAVPPPGKNGGAIDLDGRFGLHPRLAPLKDAFDAKELALIHAAGSPHPTRSHFEAQDYMETGKVGDRTAAQGWLARFLATRPAPAPGVVRAVAISERSPLALRGDPDVVAAPNLRDFRFKRERDFDGRLLDGFQRMYDGEQARLAERATRRALEASESLRRALGRNRRGGGDREAQAFADVARLIQADVGLEAAWIDLGGWDTHRQEGKSENGDLPRLLDRLGRDLARLRADLGSDFARVVVLVMSEFGRTARENGTGGTDHGHGNCMLVMGGAVQGGRVYGDFPGLLPEQLFEGRDVPVTTDFRDVFAEVCERHLKLPDAGPLFPGHALDRARRLGLFA